MYLFTTVYPLNPLQMLGTTTTIVRSTNTLGDELYYEEAKNPRRLKNELKRVFSFSLQVVLEVLGPATPYAYPNHRLPHLLPTVHCY